jgi:integrase
VFGYQHSKQINDDWMTARKIAAFDHPSVTSLSPHGARHDFAYWHRRFYQYDLKKLMEVGGWRSINSVVRYAHVPDDEVRAGFEESPLVRGKSVESDEPNLQVIEKNKEAG